MAWLQRLSKRYNSTKASSPSKTSEDQLTSFNETWLSIQVRNIATTTTTTLCLASVTHASVDVLQNALEHEEQPNIQSPLSSLLSLLNAEAAHQADAPAAAGTGPCFEYLLKNDLLSSLVSLSLSLAHAHTLVLVIHFFTSLISSSSALGLDPTLLCHGPIHKALLRLLRACVQAETDAAAHQDCDPDLVRLMTQVTHNIKAAPDLLPIFFRPSSFVHGYRPDSPSADSRSDATSSVTGKPHVQADFLLFSFLLRFVHREGQTGDQARLGLLNLIQIAFQSHSVAVATAPAAVSRQAHRKGPSIIDLNTSSASSASAPTARFAKSSNPSTTSTISQDASLHLAEWLLDSDFAEVLGAGLGALYGLLPSKLSAGLSGLQGQDVVPTDDFVSDARADELLMVTADDVSSARLTFLSLFDFTEQVLDRSSAMAGSDREKQLVAGSLRDNVLASLRGIFLESILYPSIMESSEADGSAFAVLTYLTDMLDTARREGALARELLSYLVGNDADSDQSAKKHKKKSEKLKKRKSAAMLLIEQSAPTDAHLGAQAYPADRFTLKDILLQNLELSDARTKLHQVTQAAAVRLLQMLVSKHDAFAGSLLDARLKPRATAFGIPPTAEDNDDSDEEEEEFVYPSEDVVSPAQRLEASVAQLENFKSLTMRMSGSAWQDDEYLVDGCRAIMEDPVYQLYRTADPSRQAPVGQVLNVHSSALLRLLLQHVSTFFTHAPSFNVALTGCVASLAACPTRSLEGWLVAHPGESQDGTVMELYMSLARSMADLRTTGEVERFEELLSERQESFRFVDNLADALDDDMPAASLPVADPLTLQQQQQPSSSTAPTHPFAQHYAQTADIKLMPPIAALFQGKGEEREGRMVSLSSVLDNLSVLEASIKELTGVIQARRATGIDSC